MDCGQNWSCEYLLAGFVKISMDCGQNWCCECLLAGMTDSSIDKMMPTTEAEFSQLGDAIKSKIQFFEVMWRIWVKFSWWWWFVLISVFSLVFKKHKKNRQERGEFFFFFSLVSFSIWFHLKEDDYLGALFIWLFDLGMCLSLIWWSLFRIEIMVAFGAVGKIYGAHNWFKSSRPKMFDH